LGDIFVSTTTSKRRREEKSSSIPDANGELWKVLQLLPKPFFYILAHDRELIYHSPRYNIPLYSIIEKKKELHEEYTVDGEMIFPRIYYSKDKKKTYIALVLRSVESHPKRLDMVYDRGRIVIYVTAHVFDQYHGPVYSFPPENLESYLFFHLNRSVRDLISDFLNKHGYKLTKTFNQHLDNFIMIEKGLERIYELPESNIDPGVVDFEVDHFFDIRNLRRLHMHYNMKFPFMTTPDLYFIAFKLGDGKDDDTLFFKTESRLTIERLAPVIGIESDLRRALENLHESYKLLCRSALFFRALKLGKGMI